MAKIIDLGSAPPDDPVYNQVWFFSMSAPKKSTNDSPTSADGTKPVDSEPEKEQRKKWRFPTVD